MEVQVNGITMFYEKTGSGRPMILLHGNGEDHEIFREAAEVLKEYFTVYMPDSRGHGRSTAVTEYHYRDMAEDVQAFAEALRLERPVLYGFSDGGIVGLMAAIRAPELLSALIVSGANTEPRGIRRKWLRLFQQEYRRTGDAKLKMMLREPDLTEKQLGRIRIPVLVTAGSSDMIRRRDTEKIAGAVPGSRLLILKGEDHGSYIVHQKKIAELLLSFLGIPEKRPASPGP